MTLIRTDLFMQIWNKTNVCFRLENIREIKLIDLKKRRRRYVGVSCDVYNASVD